MCLSCTGLWAPVVLGSLLPCNKEQLVVILNFVYGFFRRRMPGGGGRLLPITAHTERLRSKGMPSQASGIWKVGKSVIVASKKASKGLTCACYVSYGCEKVENKLWFIQISKTLHLQKLKGHKETRYVNGAPLSIGGNTKRVPFLAKMV